MPSKSQRRKQQKKSQKWRVYNKQKKKCYWCGKKMVMWHKGNKTGHLPDHYATWEHLHNKLDEQRQWDNKKVLACHRCNHLRGEADASKYPEWFRQLPPDAREKARHLLPEKRSE